MNQINLGESAGIDTDEVQWWYSTEADAQGRLHPAPTALGHSVVRVLFKNGNEAILRGEAMEAFDKWVEGRRQRAADAEPRPDPAPRCKTCRHYNVPSDYCGAELGCYEEREEAQ